MPDRLMLPALNWSALVVLCLFYLGGCAVGDTTEPPSPLVEFEAEADFKVLWQQSTGDGTGDKRLALQPWVTRDAIYTIDHEGLLLALNKENGKPLWRVKTGHEISAGVGGGAGMLFIGTRNGELLAYWESSGELAWQAQLSSEMLALPAADQNVVIAKTVDGNLQAFALSNGEKIWSYTYNVPSLSLHGTAAPVIFHDGVIVGSDSGRLAIISTVDGSLFQEIPIAVPVGASELERLIDVDIPALIDPQGYIYAGAYQGRVVAVSLDKMRPVWSRKKSVYQPMAQSDRNLYVVDEKSHVWSMSKEAGGSTIWVQDKLHARPVSGVGYLSDAILVGDFEGYLHALDSADGRFIARKRFGDGIQVAPVINGNTAYLLSDDGKLTALQLNRFEQGN